MKRRDFYKGTIEIINEGLAILQRNDKEIAEAKAEINSSRYSKTVIDELTEKIDSLKRQNDREISERLSTLGKHIGSMRASLEDEMSLRGSDITQDAELLKFNLSAKELVSIMNRYENNPTMVQLVLKNAEERGIDLGVRFLGNEVEINALNDIEYAAKVAFNNYSQNDIFESLFGEGSEIKDMFDIIDPPPVTTFAYSDERIGNVVRLFSDSGYIEPEIQKDIVREFENHPNVLSILRNAAVKGHKFEAAYFIDDLLNGESEDNSMK